MIAAALAWLKGLFASIETALIALVVLLLCVWVAVASIRLDLAERQLAKLQLEHAQALAQAVTEARIEEQRRVAAQAEIANEAHRQLEIVRGNADAARAAAQRLYARLAAAAANRPGGAASTPAGSPADGADVVSADVYRQLLGAARRLGDRGVDLAQLADQRGIAGTACERAYDSLAVKP